MGLRWKSLSDYTKRKAGIRLLQGKRVICVTTGEIYSSIGEAAEAKNLKKTNISAVCHNKKEFKSAGKDTDGTPLLWRFYE